jgi:hypothetical protein
MWAVARGTVEVVVGGTHQVVVRTEGTMGQCLATGGCQTLQLLLISILIISKHYKAHPVSCTKYKIQTVGTMRTLTLSLLLFV